MFGFRSGCAVALSMLVGGAAAAEPKTSVTTSLKVRKKSGSGIARNRIDRSVYDAAIVGDLPVFLHNTIRYLAADGRLVFVLTGTSLAEAKLSTKSKKAAVIKVPFRIDPADPRTDAELAVIAELHERVVGDTCLDGQLSTRDVDKTPKNGLQLDCHVSQVSNLGQDAETSDVVPRCAMLGPTTPNTSTVPCWWAEVNEQICADTPSHVRLRIERHGAAAPLDSTIVARCVTAD
jgi:hypothetical protein